MNNKVFLTIGMISLFVLGFASPASADSLKDELGEPVELGTDITATSENFGFIVGGGFTCKETRVEAEVTENGPEQITLAPFSSTMVGCELKGFHPVAAMNPTFGTISLAGGEGSSSFESNEKYALKSGLYLECTYQGTLDFTYETETDVLTVPGSWVDNQGSPACPSMKEANGDLSLSNELGQVTIE